MNLSQTEQPLPFKKNVLINPAQSQVDLLPASYEKSKDSLEVPQLRREYLTSELCMKRLEYPFVRKCLWMAGRQALPRPLHRQRLLGRTVIIVEQLDLHLSDFYLAKENHLLPHEVQWSQWQQLSSELLDSRSRNDPVTERWEYGELRLNRLNKVCRFGRLSRGAYLTKWNQYDDFWSDNIAWIGPTTVYIVVALTAMQVGLATDFLQNNAAFQRVSYGLTVFSLIALPGCLGLVAVYLVIVVVKNAIWAWQQEKAARERRRRGGGQLV
ncbi:hypothetical protein E8E14_012624 [Neopestalotiopsis sp. 37M]|nr:hypothetical protein E8E14_012624 [Neopestalotiopsis sp. 37M]